MNLSRHVFQRQQQHRRNLQQGKRTLTITPISRATQVLYQRYGRGAELGSLRGIRVSTLSSSREVTI